MKTDCLGLQWTQLALCLGAVAWGHLPCATPQVGALGHPTSERGGGSSLWANQPTGGPQAPHHWPPSHLSHKFEWVWWTCYNPLARAAGQQHKSYCRQACLPGYWYPAIPSRVAGPKVPPIDEVSTIMIASPHRSTPLNWKERQHDHGGKESPIPSSAGNVWLQVQKLDY